ncbi:MAG: hypothetical protein U1F63_06315 [Chitinivorax sp.]
MKKLLVIAGLLLPLLAAAQIEELEESDLAQVSGQDGLSINRARLNFGGVSTGTGINEKKTNSIYFGFDESSGKPTYLALEHLNGYIDFQTPLLIDVVVDTPTSIAAVRFTLPTSIDIDLGIDSISAQTGLAIDKELVNVVDHNSGALLRQEVVNRNDIGGIRVTGRMAFTPGSYVQIFGH